MATASKNGNRSAFLRDLFVKNPGLTLEGATEAWQKAGNEGEVSSSLFYNVKRAVSEKAGGEAGGGGASTQKAKPKSKGPKGVRKGRQPEAVVPESDGRQTAPKAAVSRSGVGDRERVLDKVEDRIDDLIIDLKQLGGMDEALESLRRVRRVVVRSHEG
jgi:hypothetical protein